MSSPSSTEVSNSVSENDVLVKVENVSKIFCRDLKKSLLYGLKDSVRDLVSCRENKDQETNDQERPLRPGEFWANKNISFEVRRGECLGLIGGNGAGKTTLLKMLNGLIKPDTGRIEMRGRVGALIALGAGFNPILTGRENIYVNGSVLGLSKPEIEDKIDDIIEFAEIPEFIDSPVQSYSSGMQVRLGFAIATSLNPDILILDEVLAVGDAAFQAKCFNRIQALLKSAAVIFVSHQLPQVTRICTNGMYLKGGRSICPTSNLTDAISLYEGDSRKLGSGQKIATEHGQIDSISVKFDKLTQTATVALQFEILGPECQYSLTLGLHNNQNQMIAAAYSYEEGVAYKSGPGKQQKSFTIQTNTLYPGVYNIEVGIRKLPGQLIAARSLNDASFQIEGASTSYASIKAIVQWKA